ncbi:hypothetical protein [Paracidobacterium acidisoli]|uniref:Uncharacterized protein n=1 Tax=Paracidobacterium acidisoli TaxID=2303751 RepID=A0A372IQ65_9BACT|nr:hypothetical protein [Paracidobacterium acidisoli]MBT9331455.1 hypothetical protein [Paracidobacterium acidisoli]
MIVLQGLSRSIISAGNTRYSKPVRPAAFRLFLAFPVLALIAAAARPAFCQMPPVQIVQEVVNNELTADSNNHISWMYRDAKQVPGKSTVRLVVETPAGNLSETIKADGHDLSPDEKQQDLQKIDQMVKDPDLRQKQQKNAQHDDQQARSMMEMLPKAFLWKETGRSDGEIRLSYTPNPDFSPPSMNSRVLATMSGTLVVDEKQMRLKELKGTLTQPVEFGWGLLGKLDKGGTFHILRQEVQPGQWQITQTHVHIQGHALIFKSIGDQEDEETSDYVRTPSSLSLRQAAEMLKNGTVARELGKKTDSPQPAAETASAHSDERHHLHSSH